MSIHCCPSAPTDFLAWRDMNQGDVCPFCGFIEKEDLQDKKQDREAEENEHK